MNVRCFGCNVEKDNDALEASPFAEEDGLTNKPIPPFFVLDCQSGEEFRMAVVCHNCFHALSPDMWIGKSCWKTINPTIPYERLPMHVAGSHDPALLKPLA